MNQTDYLKLYSEEYHKGHLQWAQKNNRIFRHYSQAYLDLVQPVAGDKILELGCSSGKTTRLLVDMSCQVVAVDFCPEAIDLATSWIAESPHRERAKLLCSSADEIEIVTKNQFNKVTLLDFVEHVPDTVLEKIFSNLRSVAFQGAIYVFTPSRLHFTELLRDVGVIAQDPTHINLKSRSEWMIFFQKNKLNLVKAERVASHWPILQLFEQLAQKIPFLGELFTRSVAFELRLNFSEIDQKK